MCGFTFGLGFSERNITAGKGAELTFTKSAHNNIPTDVGAKWSLLKRTMNATDFISIGIECWKHGRRRADDRRRLVFGDAGNVVDAKGRAKFIHEVGIQNIVRQRLPGMRGKLANTCAAGASVPALSVG